MRRGFFATGVITALTPCKDKGKLEVAEIGTSEAEAEAGVPDDKAAGVVVVLTEDTVGFTVVEDKGATAAVTALDGEGCGCNCEERVTSPLESGTVAPPEECGTPSDGCGKADAC